MSLIETKDAAELLGITVEALNELRSRNQIFAYRDGTNWKYKQEEVDRVLAKWQAEREAQEGSGIRLDSTLNQTSGGSGLDADLDELVAVDDLQLGGMSTDDSVLTDATGDDPTSSSTVIGRKDPNLDDILSDDFGLVDESPTGDLPTVTPAALTDGAGSELGLDLDFDMDVDTKVESTEPASSGKSEIFVQDSAEIILQESGSGLGSGSSHVDLDQTAQSIAPASAGDSELKLIEGSSVISPPKASKKGPAPDETGALAGAASGDDDLLLDSDISLDLGDEVLDLGLDTSPSDLNVGGGSDLSLAPSDTNVRLDNRVDLDAGSSDISLDAGGSGINLESPSDSGISLEQTPPELLVGGESLELGEADLLDLDDGLADFDDDTALQSDKDFLLTPVEAEGLEEADSGSQVIALDSEEFSDSGSTIFQEEGAAEPDFTSDGDASPDQGGLLTAAATMPYVPEASYSIWNVVGLGAITLLLGIAGIMMFDVIQHMWSWEEPYSLNSSLMNALTGVFGG